MACVIQQLFPLKLLGVVYVLGVWWGRACGAREGPVVTVAQGRLRGLTATHHGLTYLQFLGIPYAKPPVGTRRFKDPEPAGPWEGELDASSIPPPCDQFVLGGREDCLYLNVYTPQEALVVDYPFPVMVFIYGGGYYMGSALAYHSFETMVAKDIIVVMLQYRLGVLGFLSTEDSAASGNQGLKDQTLALRWVQDNILAFGGDPTHVTIFGGSAGASSIHYQMLAPSAAGLFSGAILQSGSALNSWARGRDFRRTAHAIADRFNCPTQPSHDLVACLQTINEHLIDESYFMFVEWNLQPFYFAPRVDGDYLPDEPVRLLQEGRYHHVPIIIGINRDEMALETVEMYADPPVIENLVSNFSSNGPVSLHLYWDEEPLTTATTVYNHYLGGLNLDKDNANNLTQMFTDGLFLVRHDWTVQLMADHIPTYTYELHHRGQHGYTNKFLAAGLDLPQAANYIAHGDNSQYTLYPKYGKLETPEDVAVGEFITSMWTNFAKTKNPTPDNSLGFIWEMTNAVNMEHLKITPTPIMKADQRAEVRAFWESLPLRINNFLHH